MGKFIDKLFDNPWFIRIMALVIALILFENVYDENYETEENVPQDQQTEVIEDVPVKIYYDAENLVVSGVPETVTVTLSGPKNIVRQAKSRRDFEVFVDLTDADIGTQKVPIQIRDISERLDVKIEPSHAEVSVQEKVTQEFNVEAEFDSKLLTTGYVAGKPVIKPNKVNITGAKNVIEKISYVKAVLDVSGPIRETFTRKAEVLVLDKDLNKLNVTVEPKAVNVTIPIEAKSKTVPIKVEQTGSLPNGIAIDSVSLENDKATIIGEEEVLNKIDSVRVELNLNKIDDDTVVSLPVIIPDGVAEVNPQTVRLTIKVKKENSRTLRNIPIDVDGLSNEYRVVFRDPSDGETNLTISGNNQDIKGLDDSDFKLYINVADLDEGDHEVAIRVNGPRGISWRLGKSSAKISIIRK